MCLKWVLKCNKLAKYRSRYTFLYWDLIQRHLNKSFFFRKKNYNMYYKFLDAMVENVWHKFNIVRKLRLQLNSNLKRLNWSCAKINFSKNYFVYPGTTETWFRFLVYRFFYLYIKCFNKFTNKQKIYKIRLYYIFITF